MIMDLHIADHIGMECALAEALKGQKKGGIPIGSALVYHGKAPGETPRILGSGHNQRVQKGSAILHGEMAALEAGGRLKPEIYRHCTMYTTLSPCDMCTGAILLYRIPRVVIGENSNFVGGEDLLRSRGVEITVQDNDACKEMMQKFIRDKPEEWYEDIGEVPQ